MNAGFKLFDDRLQRIVYGEDLVRHLNKRTQSLARFSELEHQWPFMRFNGSQRRLMGMRNADFVMKLVNDARSVVVYLFLTFVQIRRRRMIGGTLFTVPLMLA